MRLKDYLCRTRRNQRLLLENSSEIIALIEVNTLTISVFSVKFVYENII